MRKQFTRRRFLATAGAAASVAILRPSLFDGGRALAAPFVRRDVGGLSATDPIIVSYRHAIAAMRLLPNSNPLSWPYQAAIHGTTLPGPPLTAWNSCQHGNYFFWSWHRMYLYYFERIIRQMSGDPTWVLPYWNWSSPSQRHLPPMFRDTSSELYTSHRNSAMNNGTGSLPAFDVDYSSAFSQTNFTTASSNAFLQGTPHGAVHVDVGGWMGSVPTAGQDPIFYLHHCNIDRLWNLWLAQGGGRTDPLSDNPWKNNLFTFFDETGAQVQMKGCDVLRAAEQLNYTYEGEPPQVNEYCLRIIRPWWIYEVIILIRWPIPEIILREEAITIDLDIKQYRQRLATLAESKNQTLLFEMDVEAERQPGVVWEVYVGAPRNKLERDVKNPYYVGNIVLFGSGIHNQSHDKFQPAHFSFPLNRAMQAALRANEDKVPVTFVAHGVLIDGKLSTPKVEAPARITNVSLSVETQKRQ
jgi:Common central domain of tyrosinase/Polyphenol oxidase middle domain